MKTQNFFWSAPLFFSQSFVFLFLLGSIFSVGPTFAKPLTIFVSPHGNDAWNGTSATFKSASTGPVATLTQAQKIWRKAAERGGKPDEIQVFLAGGDYFPEQTLVLEDVDRSVPLTISALSGETPVLHGSVPVKGWKPAKKEEKSSKNQKNILVTLLSEAQAAACFPGDSAYLAPGQLFQDGQRLRRARHPNFDSKDPYRGGFLYVARGQAADDSKNVFSGSVNQIHNSGDSLFYEVEVPASGTYRLWMLYAAKNGSYGLDSMDGRLTMTVDEKMVLPLTGTVNTESWTPTHWANCAEVRLTKGKHRLTWQNVRGGGMNLGGFILARNPAEAPEVPADWDPNQAKDLQQTDPEHFVLIPADSFYRSIGKQLSMTCGNSKTAFRFLPGELKEEWAQPGVEVRIFQSGSCRAFLENTQVEGMDAQNGILTLTGPECVANLAKGDRYFLENHPDFLDAPGEWFFDRSTRKLYVLPLNSKSKNKKSAPALRLSRLATLIQVSGSTPKPEAGAKTVAPLKILGLEFAETGFTRDEGCVGYRVGARGVVKLQSTTDVSVEACAFRQIGRYAVAILKGGQNRVERCEIEHSAQGGVLILNASGNVVTENRIEFVGEEFKHIAGVMLSEAGSSENQITENSIHFSSRYGISMKDAGSRNLIEQNEVCDTSLETYDTGAIEVTQGNQRFQSGSIIRGNRILRTNGYSCVGDQPRFMSWGIYLDSFAGGYLVEENYVAHTSHGGFMLQGGKGNTVRKNVFIDGSQYQGYFANYIQNSENLVFEENTVVITNPEASFFGAGKELSKALTCDRNTYWCTFGNLKEQSAFKGWLQQGFDAHSEVKSGRFPIQEKSVRQSGRKEK